MDISPREYYDSVAEEYHQHYEMNLMDLSMPYPANFFRRKRLETYFSDRSNIIDVGCGDGGGTATLTWASRCGFDVSPLMIEKIKDRHFIVADLMQPETYAPLRQYGSFDGLVCMGVMPHIEDTEQAVRNLADLVYGKVFVEFRNQLFSLFTFNRLSVELVQEMSEGDWKDDIIQALSFLFMDLPPVRPYDKMLAKFHNPFEVTQLFQRNGFRKINLWYYHQHPAPPFMEKIAPIQYRRDALLREGDQGWQSMFTCSAFVVEAEKYA